MHIAAALPEVTWLEYSFLSYNHLLETPIEFCDGYAVAPDRPGHGLRLAGVSPGRVRHIALTRAGEPPTSGAGANADRAAYQRKPEKADTFWAEAEAWSDE